MGPPTEEQQIAVQRFLTLRPLKIAAFAGAGKTTTLKLLAEARDARGVYLAFNKSIAADAAHKFPRSVDCRTTHSIAFRAVMPRFRSSTKLTERLYPKQLAQEMRYQDRVFPGSIRLNRDHQAHLVLGTINRFCQSGDPEITHRHVPKYGRLLGAKDEVVSEIRSWALQQANVIWAKMLNTTDQMPLGHDGYLKAWSLSCGELRT
jgi:hypothetical protein